MFIYVSKVQNSLELMTKFGNEFYSLIAKGKRRINCNAFGCKLDEFQIMTTGGDWRYSNMVVWD